MNPLITPLIQKLKAHVPDLRLIMLFGSFAAGRQRGDSDIDLAFAAIRPLESRALFDLKMEMQVDCPRSVDLVDLANDRVSIILKYEIIQTGQALFETDNFVLSEFEARIMRDHGDLKYRRRDIEDDISKRLRAYAHV